MDIFMKTLGGALIALMMMLVMSGSRDHKMLLGLLTCCMISAVAMSYMEPVMDFVQTLEGLIPIENGMLEILLKITGIGLIGEIASMICADSGSSALGKTLQFLTGALILWLALPLMRMLLDLVSGILEGI